MSEKPILFSGPMVRAILDGRKTQTRRIIKPQPIDGKIYWEPSWKTGPAFVSSPLDSVRTVWKPRYLPGDVLWIKEAWQYAGWTEEGEPWIKYCADDSMHLCDVPEEWADRVEDVWAELSHKDNVAIDGKAADRKWRSSRLMPKWAARPDRLLVQSVRAERVQDITWTDAVSEGCNDPRTPEKYGPAEPCGDPVAEYMRLWNSINGPGAWARNDWVWVYGFERMKP